MYVEILFLGLNCYLKDYNNFILTSDSCSTNDNHSGKFIQMCDLEILLHRMAVSVVVTFLPSMTLAWENHLRLRPSLIWPPTCLSHLSD